MDKEHDTLCHADLQAADIICFSESHPHKYDHVSPPKIDSCHNRYSAVMEIKMAEV